MWRYFTEMGNHQYVQVLPQLLSGYNASKHRTIGMAPIQVKPEHQKMVWQRMYRARNKQPDTFKFNVGDLVRLSKFKWHFDKGYLPNWTDEIFVVSSRIASTPRRLYKLKDAGDELIEGKFYEDELQRVDKDLHSGEYEVERVLERRRNKTTNEQEVLVKWKGWPDKFNSWIPASRLSNNND